MKSLLWWTLLLGALSALLALLFMYKGWIQTVGAEILYTYTSNFIEEEYRSFRYRLSRPVHAIDSRPEDKFPLIIYLHGAGERGSDNKKQIRGLQYLGNGFSSQARAFRKKHPCFVYAPQCPAEADWEGDTLALVVETIGYLKSIYPIDPQRIYLVGYSMGGSGVYALAGKYYDVSGQFIAGIIRMAGQGFFTPRVHEIVSHSAVWLHIGLQDTPLRVDRVREAYFELKKIHGNPPEQMQDFSVGDGQRYRTTSVIIGGHDKVKLTEYPGMEHGISQYPFDNRDVLVWLFNQKSIL